MTPRLALTTSAAALAFLAGCASTGSDARWTADVYEDGSGIVYLAGVEVASYGDGHFPWDCTSNGNNACGATAPQSVRGPSCVTFAIPAYATRLEFCTDTGLRVL